MSKKKIGIIVAVVALFICVGLGFNSMFSKAQADNEIKTKQEQTVASGDENKEKESSLLDSENNSEEKSGDDKKDDVEKDDENSTDSDSSDEAKDTNTGTNANKDDENKDNQGSTGSDKDDDKNNDVKPNPDENKKPEEDKGEEKPKPDPEEDKEDSKPVVPVPPPVPEKKKTVTIAISCNTAINNGVHNQPGFSHLPSSGSILGTTTIEIENGDTVFDVLVKATKQKGIHMEYTGAGSTIYIEGIHNLYEFDGGDRSGWMYSVNGWYPNYGAGVYELKDGDVIKWNYTCDLGYDLGAGMS